MILSNNISCLTSHSTKQSVKIFLPFLVFFVVITSSKIIFSASEAHCHHFKNCAWMDVYFVAWVDVIKTEASFRPVTNLAASHVSSAWCVSKTISEKRIPFKISWPWLSATWICVPQLLRRLSFYATLTEYENHHWIEWISLFCTVGPWLLDGASQK